MGVPLRGLWPRLRHRSAAEAAGFWSVLILTYLGLSQLSTIRGIGYVEVVACGGDCVVFDYHDVLWLPQTLGGGDPVLYPAQSLLWWVLLSALVASSVVLVSRLVLDRVRPPSARSKAGRERVIPSRGSRAGDGLPEGESKDHRREARPHDGVPRA